MKKLVVGSWFDLPRLGTDVFSSLMKAGVKYERGKGFMLTQGTDLRAASHTIEAATGEAVGLSVPCAVCGAECCETCVFRAFCDRRSVSPTCLCDEHASGEDAFQTYVRAFESRLAQ